VYGARRGDVSQPAAGALHEDPWSTPRCCATRRARRMEHPGYYAVAAGSVVSDALMRPAAHEGLRSSRRAHRREGKGLYVGNASKRHLARGMTIEGLVYTRATASSCPGAPTLNPSGGSSHPRGIGGDPHRHTASPLSDADSLRGGCRPNFMKLAPVDRELVKRRVEHVIVPHRPALRSGMSDALFRAAVDPGARHDLGVGSGSHAQQTAA